MTTLVPEMSLENSIALEVKLNKNHILIILLMTSTKNLSYTLHVKLLSSSAFVFFSYLGLGLCFGSWESA